MRFVNVPMVTLIIPITISLFGCGSGSDKPTSEDIMAHYNNNVIDPSHDAAFQILAQDCGITEPEQNEVFSVIVHSCEAWQDAPQGHILPAATDINNASIIDKMFRFPKTERIMNKGDHYLCDVTIDIKPAYNERQVIDSKMAFKQLDGDWRVNDRVLYDSPLLDAFTVDCYQGS